VNSVLTKTTAGVRITVHPRFEENLSSAVDESYVIFDSQGIKREVEGAGVVGETPIIMPGEYFSYSSACDLQSPRGSMHGFYTMQRFGSEQMMEINVPQFNLEAPHSLS
jgi:ApaG protein